MTSSSGNNVASSRGRQEPVRQDVAPSSKQSKGADSEVPKKRGRSFREKRKFVEKTTEDKPAATPQQQQAMIPAPSKQTATTPSRSFAFTPLTPSNTHHVDTKSAPPPP
eukprot:CAMPEP_0185793734 /NCGR_PEP_ID=MMETSP1174-20130828/159636_1 /TAXON_ID=35687 /ORGANISM="Dictyocha speculum, Strain CCMP1381" /LENGTH=108 /DNA_ID=CAMNT_0028488911 /DNA_START=1421 /DNA_END=1743 /DNA_ORIENTATION=-